MATTNPITLLSSAERSGSGFGSAQLADGGTMRLTLAVTASAHSAGQQKPKALNAWVEHGPTSNGPWSLLPPTVSEVGKFANAHARFDPSSEVHTEYRTFAGVGEYVRAGWQIQDGVRVTFSLGGIIL